MSATKTQILLEEFLKLLRSRHFTVGFAESCTGGLLSATLTALPGVSDVFMGSVVSYANEVKTDLLNVTASALTAEGAVSETVARQMAQGARKQLKVDMAVAITGIAGPTGGSPDKPVGTVCFAVSGPGNAMSSVRTHFSGNRVEVQQAAVRFAIAEMISALKKV